MIRKIHTSMLIFFYEICETFKLNLLTKDEAKIILFSQTLRERAKAWYEDRLTNETDTWEILPSTFMSKFHPGRKSPGAKVMIFNLVWEIEMN